MLNRLSDIIRLRAFADTLIQPVGRAGPNSLPGLVLGEQVYAHVESTRPDGAYRVFIESQPFDLRLPFHAQPGDVIPLRVAAREPRLKFAVEPGSEPPAPATLLSETARFITALLGESEKLPLTAVSQSGAPLLAESPGDSSEIAVALRNALAYSGIFYESHQAEWIAGERSLATLSHEPQAQLAPLGAASQEPSPATAITSNDNAAPLLPDLPVHRDALPIVRQQLETLDTRHVVWNGLIWQDQPLEWKVAEEPGNPAATPDERRWITRIKLTLPRLGNISANLSVSVRGVTINLSAATSNTATALAARRTDLLQALDRAGVTALSIAIGAHETI